MIKPEFQDIQNRIKNCIICPVKNVPINSNIDFYIGKKLVKGKTKSSLIKSKDARDESYIDVNANGKTYLCKFDHNRNKFYAVIN